MSGTQVAILPANIQLPAHLQTAEALAAIAAYNAAAAGGIKSGGFPRISIKGGKFHIVKGGETTTLMMEPAPGQPALPRMVLEVVVVAANPNLSKKFYEGDYVQGDDREPTCSSDNGQVPDSHIGAPQSANCAQCPQNQWGSKVSKASGKDVKACSDEKRLAILPAQDLKYEALGFAVTPSSLGDWGKYVKALSDRNISVNAVVTNVTFDTTASYPKTLFSFNRFLDAAEYEQVQARAAGDDVKNIVNPVRQIVPQLAAPAAPVPAAPPAPPVIPIIPVQPPAPVQQPVVANSGFGAAAPVAPAPAAPPVQQPLQEAPPKKTRAPRKTAAVDTSDLSHLPPEILSTVNLLGVNDPTAQALIAKYPKPAVEPAAPVAAAPAPAAPAATSGFGGAVAAAIPTPAPAAPAAGGAAPMSLKDQLAARLAAGQQKAAAAG